MDRQTDLLFSGKLAVSSSRDPPNDDSENSVNLTSPNLVNVALVGTNEEAASLGTRQARTPLAPSNSINLDMPVGTKAQTVSVSVGQSSHVNNKTDSCKALFTVHSQAHSPATASCEVSDRTGRSSASTPASSRTAPAAAASNRIGVAKSTSNFYCTSMDSTPLNSVSFSERFDGATNSGN